MAKSFENGAFSFADVSVAISGPNIDTTVTGIAEEGVTIEYDGDAGLLVMGADGSGMFSERVAQNGTIRIRLLKTASYNQILSNAFYFQRGSTVNTAKNTIIVRDPVRGDLVTAQGCAFQKFPNLTFATAPGINEWAFLCQRITADLGAGIDYSIVAV